MGQQQEGTELMTSPLELLRAMTRIRMVEEEIAKRYPQQQMRCPVHLSIGQEAAAVGVCHALKPTDWALSGHRNHAHYLAKGGNLKAMVAEIYGKATGCCGGRGGSMHLTDLDAGFIGATPIVGSTVPIAVGAALTAQREEKGRVVVVFLGDGAMEAGVVHESLNFALLKKLPILFACENNLYSVYSPLEVRQPTQRSISDLATGHGMKTVHADGNDAQDVYSKTCAAVHELRQGLGPVFMELPTYRWLEHCGPGYDNDIGYRTEAEFQHWRQRDPLAISSQQSSAVLMSAEIVTIRQEIEDAFSSAISDPFPDPASAGLHVYAPANNTGPVPERGTREITYAEALREAQDLCLSKYDNSYLMGLGVPDPKGIFGTTLGLQGKYGAERVFDIPLAENAMTGVAIGSAITGMRPILTHQRLDFALVSIDQIVNQAAKWHYMFNGLMNVPLVIRMIIGRGWGQGPQHSQSLQAWFAHIPGLKVVMPSSPYDAKGMLISAIEDDNPVLFIEHRWLHTTIGYVPEGYFSVPLTGCSCIADGDEITIVSTAYAVNECRLARSELARYNISAQILDLRSINPIDYASIYDAVEKTRRLLIVDHAASVCGIASEVISRIAECSKIELKSKPRRLTLPDYPCPTSAALTKDYYLTAADIVLDVLIQFGRSDEFRPLEMNKYFTHNHDQPNPTFTGPF
jgi:2-oxoisovalerate dehydrogenase E1 component